MNECFELETPWKKLHQKWEYTKANWDDPVSLEFEQTFLISFAEQMQRTQRELKRLMQVIEQAQRSIR